MTKEKIKTIKILDLVIDDLSLINLRLVAEETGLSYSYVWYLIKGERTNHESLEKVRDALVKLYGGILKSAAA